MSFMSDMLKHLNRMVMWRLNRIRPTANEAIKMDNAGISADDTLRAFIAWRRTNMLLAVPITFASAVMATVDTGNLFSDKTYMELWNALGKVTFLLPSVAALVLFIAVGASSFWWTNWRRTRLLIRVGWSLSFLLAFIPALFPVNSLLTEYWLDYYTTNDPASLQAEKIRRALVYIMVVLPLVVTFPGGAVRAAVRIRGLLPESALSSWILVISAPFYSLLILMAFVVVIQLLGSPTLVVGSVLLTLSPWTYVVFRKSFAWSVTGEEEKRVDWIQRGAGLSSLFGFVLVVVWALTDDTIGEYMTYKFLATLVLRGVGNGLVTSIVFCDSFFRMAVTNWKMEGAKRRALGTDNIDRLFSVLEGSIRKPEQDSFNVTSAKMPSSSKRDSLKSESHESEEDDVEKGIVKETEDEHCVPSSADDDAQAPRASSIPSTAQKTKSVQRTITNKDGSKTVVEETIGPDGAILSSKTTTITPTTTEAATSLDL